MSTPAISILTPVWNGLPYLKECVDSVLAQDFQDWEMIVADNCSNDGTSEYLRGLTDPRIKVYRHDKNRGVYRNIKFLFEHATAPLFVGLCADDYFYPGSLQKIMDEWGKTSPDISFISFNWKNRPQRENRFDAVSYDILPKNLRGIDVTFAFFLFGNIPGNFSEVSGRVPVVADQHFLYDIKFSADYEYWLRLSKREGLSLNTSEVVYIRRHDRVAATYAITKGEYHEESIAVYEDIIDELSRYADRASLIRFYNLHICSYHLRAALGSALRGSFTALKSFFKQESRIFWRFQFLRCLPFALSEEFRFDTTIKLARNIWNDHKKRIPQMDQVEVQKEIG